MRLVQKVVLAKFAVFYLLPFSFFVRFVLFRPSYLPVRAGVDWLRPFPFRVLINRLSA
jgi:hypothetical protein